MMQWSSDQEKFDLIKQRLYTSVVSDTLDRLGYMKQAMRHDIRPLHPDFTIVGRARTLLWMNVYQSIEPNPYLHEIRAIDALRPGDVAVHSTDHSWNIAAWGELLSIASKMRGAVGTVADACVRDVRQIIAMGFATFARGIMPLDSWGRGFVADFDVPIECGGVRVTSGDLVFADYDGILVIPKEVEEEALNRALEKVKGENRTRDALMQGRLLSEVYDEHGVL